MGAAAHCGGGRTDGDAPVPAAIRGQMGKGVVGESNFLLRVRRVAAALALLALCAGMPSRAEDGVLVLGRVSDDPRHQYAQLKPLLDYVVPRMADVGIREGRILMARNVQQMDSYLRRGRVDWVTETAATGMLLAERADAQLLLMTERDGRASYASVLFARRDHGIVDLAGLRGHVIAFQNRASASAYLVPAGLLLDAGHALEILLSPQDRPSADAVGFVFARTENNIFAWVDKGLVEAGAVSDIDWNELAGQGDGRVDALVEIARSPSFPRGVELVRNGLPHDVHERLRAILMHAPEDAEGRAALAQFFGTSGFHRADDAERAALQQMRRLALRVKAAIE